MPSAVKFRTATQHPGHSTRTRASGSPARITPCSAPSACATPPNGPMRTRNCCCPRGPKASPPARLSPPAAPPVCGARSRRGRRCRLPPPACRAGAHAAHRLRQPQGRQRRRLGLARRHRRRRRRLPLPRAAAGAIQRCQAFRLHAGSFDGGDLQPRCLIARQLPGQRPARPGLHRHPHLRGAAFRHPQQLRCAARQADGTPGVLRPAIVHPHRQLPPIFQVGDGDDGRQLQGAMCRHQQSGLELLAIAGALGRAPAAPPPARPRDRRNPPAGRTTARPTNSPAPPGNAPAPPGRDCRTPAPRRPAAPNRCASRHPVRQQPDRQCVVVGRVVAADDAEVSW